MNTQTNTTNGRELRYPHGLEEMPQLLDEIEFITSEIARLTNRVGDLSDTCRRLAFATGRLRQFTEVRVEQARIRERRRSRRRRDEDPLAALERSVGGKASWLELANRGGMVAQPELSNGGGPR